MLVLKKDELSSFADPSLEAFPQAFATSLFSFLYHLASYETGDLKLIDLNTSCVLIILMVHRIVKPIK